MHIEYHKMWSEYLNQDMELKLYGHSGKPVVIFPTLGGRFFEYEDHGLISACEEHLENGRVRLITVDGIDLQTWYNPWMHPADRARRYNEYDHYIVREVNRFIQAHCQAEGKFVAIGAGWGAYHAANFFFKHPDVFESIIGLSGTYGLHYILGNYMDENVYYNSPLNYLPSLENPWFLNQMQNSRIILCVGQGPWDDHARISTEALKQILESKEIPVQVDYWGHETGHWPWWQQQLPHYLEELT